MQQRELLRIDRAVGDDTMPSRKLLHRRIGHHWVLCVRTVLRGVSEWLLHLPGRFNRRWCRFKRVFELRGWAVPEHRRSFQLCELWARHILLFDGPKQRDELPGWGLLCWRCDRDGPVRHRPVLGRLCECLFVVPRWGISRFHGNELLCQLRCRDLPNKHGVDELLELPRGNQSADDGVDVGFELFGLPGGYLRCRHGGQFVLKLRFGSLPECDRFDRLCCVCGGLLFGIWGKYVFQL